MTTQKQIRRAFWEQHPEMAGHWTKDRDGKKLRNAYHGPRQGATEASYGPTGCWSRWRVEHGESHRSYCLLARGRSI